MYTLADGRFALFRPSLNVAVETTAALAGLLAAYLVFFRFRRSCALDDLLLACGLAVLSFGNLVYGAAPAALDHYPDRFTTWALATGQIVGSLLLALAAFAPAHVFERPWRASWLVCGAAVVALVGFGGLLNVLAHDIPVVSGASGHDAALGVHLGRLVIFAAAVVGFVRCAERTGDELMTWFAFASTLGALAGLNYAFHPSLDSRLVYTGDAFRLLFYGALLAGTARELGRYWQEAERAAVLSERRRIARDLHDSIAQEISFIARRMRHVRSTGGDRRVADQIVRAAERALDESRRTIAALTRPLDEPLDVVLAQEVEDVAERSGTILALSLDPGVAVEPDVREALLRIAREAVVNAARHGDARLVEVELENGKGLLLRVADDGRGFDPERASQTSNGGFGLVSMRERAHAIGADLRVESRPGDGTTVEVELR